MRRKKKKAMNGIQVQVARNSPPYSEYRTGKKKA